MLGLVDACTWVVFARYPLNVLISDRDIRQEIADGRIVLDPFDESMIQPASVDVRIDRFFRLFDNHKYPHIDPAQPQEDLTRLVEVAPDEPFILHPGEFVLGSTYEKVTLPDDVAARLEGKSSLGRLGLLTHSTAGFIDPGFSGHVTLELSNMATLPNCPPYRPWLSATSSPKTAPPSAPPELPESPWSAPSSTTPH